MKKVRLKILAFLTLYSFMWAHVAVADSEKLYVGCYSCCFESNIFMPIPNQNNESWSVVSKPENFWAGVNKSPAQEGEPIYFLKVKAKLGKVGQFGHMGLANHEMEITHVLELREYKKSDGICNISLPPENISDQNVE